MPLHEPPPPLPDPEPLPVPNLVPWWVWYAVFAVALVWVLGRLLLYAGHLAALRDRLRRE